MAFFGREGCRRIQEGFIMRIIEAKDYADASRKAAAIMAAQVVEKPDCVLGLATGSTPLGAYELLAKWCSQGDLDFSKVSTVNLDEYRGLGHDHEQGYYYFMNKNLFSKINIDLANVNVPNGLEPDPAKESERYEGVIASLGGIDLQLLGIGHDGHIGFNEPNNFFDNNTHCVDLTEMTIQANKRFFASADEVPKQAYTMGIGTIMRARKILMLITGEDKADILKAAFYGEVTPEVPASILQFHPDVTLVADAAALSKVK